MAYSLYCWREITKRHAAADAICSRLFNDDEEVEDLAWFPIREVKERFAESFPEIDDALTELNWEDGQSYFQVTWPIASRPAHTQAIFIECGYQLLQNPGVMNRILGVAQELGCVLYDPQADARSSH